MAADSSSMITLHDWISQLPVNIDYEHKGRSWSRLEFLQLMGGIAGSGGTVIVYLLDRDERQQCFLTLSYVAGIAPNQVTLPRRIMLPQQKEAFSFAQARAHFLKFANANNCSIPLVYRLTGYRDCEANDDLLSQDEIGLGLVLIPNSTKLTELSRVKLQLAWRFFAVQTTRSRHERLSLAISKMLKAAEKSATKAALCSVLAQYARSQRVLLYQRLGTAYELAGEFNSPNAPSATIRSFSFSDAEELLDEAAVLRSHTYSGKLPKQIRDLVGSAAWMLLPCHTQGSDVLSGEHLKSAQYLIFLIGKENTEYLGEDFSFTDLSIGTNLVSLLAGHLPFMGLSEKLRELSKELDEHALSGFALQWLSDLSRRHLPSLFGVALLPDSSGGDSPEFYPAAFQMQAITRRMSDDSRDNEACAATTESGAPLWCLVFRIHTEYRTQQRIAFAFQHNFIQSADSQILEMIVEYVRTAFGVIDFREYHNATQAQIRHVIRGSLSAAVSELELMAQRVQLFSNMPSKLARLLATPTMQTSMHDALLWLNEAYSLADAPRYLLETFNKRAVRWADVDPAAIVDSVINMAKGEIRRRGLRVQFIRGAGPPRFISGDSEFLKIVFFNLIDNAIKYSFQDKWLHVDLIYTNERFRAEIQNEGVPISPEDREKIFHPWVRSFKQSFATRRPGTGLGLAVSQRILQAHDENVVFDFTSVPIDEKAAIARTTFFFELSLKGKGAAA
jgi:signal transduction histidine kinase